MNERVTENIIREHFKKSCDIILNEQQTKNDKIQKLLKYASKSGNKDGRPDFIIEYKNNTNLLIVIECKADLNKHGTDEKNEYKDYAVDGVKLYASFLSKEYDIIAIAISGDDKNNLKVNHYLQLKGTTKCEPIFKNDVLLSANEYLESYKKDERKFYQDFMSLLTYSSKLNDKLHILKIPESQRSLLIAGTLIALNNASFLNSYKTETSINSLIENFLIKVKHELLNVENKHIEAIITTFSFLKTHSILSKDLKIFKDVITEIDDNINSFIKNYKYFDTLGQFYIEFLKYANNDKGLGIVLTPPHITQFFCELAKINEHSIVLDNCAGTGGFLISAMREMLKNAGGNKDIEYKIKAKQIIGIEIQHDIFTLLCCNMYMHGDGRSNLFKGSCFDDRIKEAVKKFKPNAGFLNPPYRSNKKNDIYELEYVLNNISMLEKGSLCIAIVPISCAMSNDKKLVMLKQKLLQEHTLDAVLSMPNELFKNSNVGVNTCVMILKAKEAHKKDYKTLFMYCKDDGFINKKTQGRADYDKIWEHQIKDKWAGVYKNKDEIIGFSIKKEVKGEDEWCVEAYMKTDYTKLKQSDFENELFTYMIYLLSNKLKLSISIESINKNELKLFTEKWKYFKISDLFRISGTKSIVYRDLQKYGKGNFPYITTSSLNNGCRGFFDYWTEKKNVLTIDSACIGICFYQGHNFSATDHVEKLTPKFNMNCYNALFLTTLINLEQYRYNYGRGFAQIRIKNTIIKLPVNSKDEPDFEFMENYIKSLPFSKNLENF
ncbi:MAG: N-6 DNA methylase [Elusimicrobiota bacterium]|jgi:type I restriction-modification system DNA methylase subunit|nr:N-6 DNA methylase [Elusimicrobiota bacterium]